VLERLRAEYLEMPGLRLTVEQVQRLCGIARAICSVVLDTLVEANFLCPKSNGAYARLTDGDISGGACQLRLQRPRHFEPDGRNDDTVGDPSIDGMNGNAEAMRGVHCLSQSHRSYVETWDRQPGHRARPTAPGRTRCRAQAH
jgi:hypothetical protein